MTKKMLKQAEQNVINQAKFWTDFFDFIDSMQYSIADKIDEQGPDRGEFAEGFRLLRQAAYKQMQFALARNFYMVGVGGEAAEAYSRERAARMFGGRYTVINWLDEWCRLPRSWKSSDEAALRAELADALAAKKGAAK